MDHDVALEVEMTAPIVLLVAVAANANGVAMTRVAAATCIEAMPAGAQSVVRLVPILPDDRDLAADASAEGANAVVVLTWHDAEFLTTDVRVSVAPPGIRGHDWIARTVVFSAHDLPAERGRTLGLVIASMLEESRGSVALRNRDAVELPTVSPGEPRPVDTGSSPIAADVAVSGTAVLAAHARWAIEANLTTIVDSAEGLDVDALGGSFAVRRSMTARLALRAGLGYRVATIDGADAITRTASVALGGAWTSPALGRPRELGFGAQLDLLGLHEEVARDSRVSTAPNNDQGYWSLGGELLGQIGYGLSLGTAVLFGGGLEETLTAADIVVAGRQIATIPHQRLVFELGILSRF
jgi:hypothetical protein